jgi:hypothetical protein
MDNPDASKDVATLTVIVPLTYRKRGGRKPVIAPEGHDSWSPPRPRVDNTLVKALARAHRWKRKLECGEFATIEDVATAEKINPSYLCRILRLTLLAPDIVEAILNGRQPPGLQLDPLLEPFPVDWQRQRDIIQFKD